MAIVDQGNSAQYDYGDLVSLYLWGREKLTGQQDAQVRAALVPRRQQVSGWTFSKLQQVHGRMNRALMPKESIHQLTVSWLEGRDMATLGDVEQLSWPFQQVGVIDREPTAPRSFSVQWSSTITAPSDQVGIFALLLAKFVSSLSLINTV